MPDGAGTNSPLGWSRQAFLQPDAGTDDEWREAEHPAQDRGHSCCCVSWDSPPSRPRCCRPSQATGQGPVTAEAYGAPGTLIPVVVRLRGAKASTRADRELATPDVAMSCAGEPWFDPARHILSQTCVARMPANRSHVHLRGYAYLRA